MECFNVKLVKLSSAIMIAVTMITIVTPMNANAATWKKDETGWWYQLDQKSYVKDGWKYIDGEWYYFDERGYMEIGWVNDNGTWYYLNEGGAMETGWVNDNGIWYYLNEGGAMETGWVNDNGIWYYLNDSGAMQTGWVEDGGFAYYLNNDGVMATGWLEDNGIWYYMNPDGSKETGFVDVTDKYTQLGLKSEEITWNISGVKKDYTFLWVSDLHVIAGTAGVGQDDLVTVNGYIEGLHTSTGVRSAELWGKLPDILDSYQADAIFFGGDMLVHASEEDILCLKEGMDQIKTPFIYVRADHDLVPFYCEDKNTQRVNELHAQIDGNNAVSLMEYEDLCVVGINNSTSQMTAPALEQVKSIYAKGKPMIIVTHVPLNSMVDGGLSARSTQIWQERNLSWGRGCYYEPDSVTQEFLDMVYAEDSLIKGVLCGHMHFSWEGQLTSNTKEHVFSPAVGGTIGIVHIR